MLEVISEIVEILNGIFGKKSLRNQRKKFKFFSKNVFKTFLRYSEDQLVQKLSNIFKYAWVQALIFNLLKKKPYKFEIKIKISSTNVIRIFLKLKKVHCKSIFKYLANV